MLLGLWKNVEELELSINLDELQAILEASHKVEHRHNKFAAALKGVDLDKGNAADAKERFDAIQQRVNARISGKSEVELEFDAFGLDIETD